MAWIIELGAGKSLGIVFPALSAVEPEFAIDGRTACSDVAAHDMTLVQTRRRPSTEHVLAPHTRKRCSPSS